MRFLNRTDELGLLRDRVKGSDAELLVVYGRRRVGKTELLSCLAQEARSLYFEATDTVTLDQLADLTHEIALASDNAVLAEQPLTTWPAALAAIAAYVGRRRTVVVLDEFQLLAQRSPELESTLSRWWRTTGRHLPIVLVLAGSEVSFFESRVLAGQLYGRRTGQMKVLPFLAREAALFHPDYSAVDRIRTYAVCGGIPYYLERFTDDRPLANHLLDEVFERTGLLHDEAELMLRQSIAEPANYIAVLRAIAHGQNRNNEIAQRTQLTPAHVNKVVDVLERLNLVERLRPVTAPPRSKTVAYAIADQFLRFHYRFVEPGRSQLRTRQLARAYVRSAVLPKLDHHTSRAWEEVCQQHVQRTLPGVITVGRWWGTVPTGEGRRTELREVDVVALDAVREVVAIGTCKWTDRRVDFDELNLLERLAPSIGAQGADTHRYLFSRSGFTDRLRRHADDDDRIRLITPDDIYR